MSEHSAEHTPEPWAYEPSTEHHGPYVTSEFGSTICDGYAMSNPSALSVRNGGDSKPIPFLAEMADPNMRRIAAAVNACQCLSTEALEQSVVAKMREALELVRRGIKTKHIKDVSLVPRVLPGMTELDLTTLSSVVDGALSLANSEPALALSRSGPEDRGTV